MSTSKDKDIGNRLLFFREGLGLSQKQMADSLSISLSAYQNYERGDRSITKEVICVLLEKYNVEPKWILIGDGNMYECASIDVELLGDIANEFEMQYKLWVEENPAAYWIMENLSNPDHLKQMERPAADEFTKLFSACRGKSFTAKLMGDAYNDVIGIENQNKRNTEIRSHASNHAVFIRDPSIAKQMDKSRNDFIKRIENNELTPEEKKHLIWAKNNSEEKEYMEKLGVDFSLLNQ